MKRICIVVLVVFLVVVSFAAPHHAFAGNPHLNEESPLGANLNFLAAWSSEYSFVDAFKQSSPWIAQVHTTWQTVKEDHIDLDKNGWPKSMQDTQNSANRFAWIGTVMFDSLEGNYPVGDYLVVYDGEGTIEYTRDAVKVTEWPEGGKTVVKINVDPARGGNGIMLKIVETDPQGTGDYIRNIRVISPGFEYDTKEVFHPDFLANVNNFKVLRFMDWMRTNWAWDGSGPIREGEDEVDLDAHPLHDATSNPYVTKISAENEAARSALRGWDERSRASDARYSTELGAPVEIMTALANETGANPWVNMPHMASDEWIRGFAAYMRDNLNPEQHIYVEYSNEVWNSGFYQAQWVEAKGKAEWPRVAVSDLEKRLSWYGKRAAEMCDIWETTFAQDAERVRCLIATQAANDWLGEKTLDCPLWEEAPCYEHNVDAVAIAPYFGQHLGQPQYEDDISEWLNDADGGLTKLFQELEHGDVLPMEQWLTKVTVDQAKSFVNDYGTTAVERGIDLVAYEGGQHLVGVSTVLWNDGISDLFMQANRDPRMHDLYLDYYSNWLEVANDVHVLYSTVGSYSRWGSWGMQEFMKLNSPKRNAVEDFLENHDCPWVSCDAPLETYTAVGIKKASSTNSADTFILTAFVGLLLLTVAGSARLNWQTISNRDY